MQAAPDKNNGLQRFWRYVVQQMRDDWPAVIFVACLFSILDNYFGWLRAVESHAFVAIGNVAAQVRGHEAGGVLSGPRALFVQIDQQTLETRYHERSPLNRCELQRDLADVYAAMQRYNDKVAEPTRRLNVLVVDLDLRPWEWLKTADGSKSPEADCERSLYEDIRNSQQRWQVHTVLMKPMEVVDQLKPALENWMAESKGKVSFGHAHIPVNFGLAISQYCEPDTMAAVAFQLWAQKWPEGSRPKSECIPKADDKTAARSHEPRIIDPRQYRTGVIPLALAHEPGSEQRAELLNGMLLSDVGRNSTATDGWQAVFFGAGYGSDDLFVTPIADLYGAEVHAAGFLTLIEPVSEGKNWLELLTDIVFGFVFGLVTAGCWRSFYRRSLSDDVKQRLTAPYALALMSVLVVATTILLVAVSYVLLLRLGIWASPVSMAVGMLFDSFVFGPAQHGVGFGKALQGATRPERRSFAEGARKLFGGAIVHFWRKGEYFPAGLLTFRLILWLGVVVWAIVLISEGE